MRITIAALALTGFSFGQSCHPPTSSALHRVHDYIVKRYAKGVTTNVTLVDLKQAGESCFWMIGFRLLPEDKPLQLFLTPDNRFLVPDFFDLSADPRVEDLQKAAAFMRPLVAGAPPSMGPRDAAVTIVMFEDFECPFCKQLRDLLATTLPSTRDRGVRVIFRHFPLPMHPWAAKAAILADCVAHQDVTAFWKLSDFLFANQDSITQENLSAKLDAYINDTLPMVSIPEYERCNTDTRAQAHIDQDLALGRQYGVDQTPTFFINGTKVSGVPSAKQFQEILSAAQNGYTLTSLGDQ